MEPSGDAGSPKSDSRRKRFFTSIRQKIPGKQQALTHVSHEPKQMRNLQNESSLVSDITTHLPESFPSNLSPEAGEAENVNNVLERKSLYELVRQDEIIEETALLENGERKFLYPSLQEAFQSVYSRRLPAVAEKGIDGASFIDAKGDMLQMFTATLEDAPVRIVRLENITNPLRSYAIDPENNPRMVDRFSLLQDEVFIEDMTTGMTLPVSQILPKDALLYFFPQKQLEPIYNDLALEHFRQIPRGSVAKEILAGRWKEGLQGKQLVLFSDIESIRQFGYLFHEISHGVEMDARGSTMIEGLWDLSPNDMRRLEGQGISAADINNELVQKERNAWALAIRLARRLEQGGFSAVPSLAQRFAEGAQKELGTYDRGRLPRSIPDSPDMMTFTDTSRRKRRREQEESAKPY